MDLLTPVPREKLSKLFLQSAIKKEILCCKPLHTYPKEHGKETPNTLHKGNTLEYILFYCILCQLIFLILFIIQNTDFTTPYLAETHKQFYTQCTCLLAPIEPCSLNPHNNPVRKMLYERYPFYIWGHWGTQRLSGLPKVTQYIQSKEGFDPDPHWATESRLPPCHFVALEHWWVHWDSARRQGLYGMEMQWVGSGGTPQLSQRRRKASCLRPQSHHDTSVNQHRRALWKTGGNPGLGFKHRPGDRGRTAKV